MEVILFDHSHYVPILRWKWGERNAIGELRASRKADVTPLIELVPTDYNLVKKNKQIDIPSTSEKFTNELNDCWGTTTVFLDLQHISGISKTAQLEFQLLENILDHSKKLNLSIIPVIYLGKDSNFNKTIKDINKQNKNALCLRLNYWRILQADFQDSIDQLFNQLSLKPKETDLIVDYGSIYNDIKPDIASNVYSKIPYIDSWRTFTFASGVFPQYLSELYQPGRHQLNRDDWMFWLNNFYKNSSERIPTFSDYTIQHPKYIEPPTTNNPGANIIYTSYDYWVIMKGEALRKKGGTGHAQYPASARLLKESIEFCGENFSYGDTYVFQKALDINTPKTGTPKEWLKAGINHHITFVVDQLSNLGGS